MSEQLSGQFNQQSNQQLNPGQKFGRLTVIKSVGVIKGYRAYLFGCDCGKQKVLSGSVVRHGRTRSCGCGRQLGFKAGARPDRVMVGSKYPTMPRLKRTMEMSSGFSTKATNSTGSRLSLLKARAKALKTAMVSERLERLTDLFRTTVRTF